MARFQTEAEPKDRSRYLERFRLVPAAEVGSIAAIGDDGGW